MKKLGLITLLILGLLIAGGLWFAQAGRMRILSTALSLVAPHLPFQIAKVEMDRSHLRLELTLPGFPEYRSIWDGPIQFRNLRTSTASFLSDGLELTYKPTITLLHERNSSPPLQLELITVFNPKSFRLTQVTLALAGGHHWKWETVGIHFDDLKLRAEYKEGTAVATLLARNLQFERTTRTARLDQFQASVNAPLFLQPFHLNGPAQLDVQLGDSEVLWNQLYLDLPLSQIPLHAEIQPDKVTGRIDLKPFRGSLSLEHIPSQGMTQLEIILPELGKLSQVFQKAAPEQARFIRGLEIKKGSLHLQTKIKNTPTGAPEFITPHLEIKNLHARWPSQFLAIHNLNLIATSPTEARLSFDNFAYKKLKAKLAPTALTLHLDNGTLKALSLGGLTPLPLEIEEIPLQLSKLDLSFGREIELHTSMELPPTDLNSITQKFCIALPKLPLTTISFRYPRLDLSPSIFAPIGELKARILGGEILVSEMGGFDLATEVPEIDFSAKVSGIRLDELGTFFNFGEMDGIVQGEATDVQFQSWLPTSFHFVTELKPLHHSDIVFSPEAMKNFVKLFTGEDIDSLPGVADWWIFGWPRRVLGGYDIDYAGIEVDSKGGVIILQTMDPPDVLARYKKHFILFGGQSFRIPLLTSRYPVVVDATAMNNFLRQTTLTLEGLRLEKKDKTHAKVLPADCQPPL